MNLKHITPAWVLVVFTLTAFSVPLPVQAQEAGWSDEASGGGSGEPSLAEIMTPEAFLDVDEETVMMEAKGEEAPEIGDEAPAAAEPETAPDQPASVSAPEPVVKPTPVIAAPEIKPIHPVAREQQMFVEPEAIFDDTLLLAGYTEKFWGDSPDILFARIEDENLDNDFKKAAAVRVFKQQYAAEIFNREKNIYVKRLLRVLNRTRSPFVQVEIMHTLCLMDRYRYFASMAPALILKLDHYNKTVSAMSFDAMTDLVEHGHNRAREARIVFNTLRRILFLSRRRLADVAEPDERLSNKLELLRWSIKVLGTQELKRLPKEVINLL